MGSPSPGDPDATAVIATTESPGAEAVDPTAMAPGSSLGRYLVIEEIGRGGMGVVLRGYDPKLQREVALKVVRATALGASAMARLVREARAMARLSHPNVVAVYDVELSDDDHGVVMVMELVRGTTLRQWMTTTNRGWRAIVDAFVAAGRGLGAAHAEGLLHRDFKSDNVLVGDEGRVRVTDFGLARAASSRPSADPIGVASVDDAISADGVSEDLTEAGFVMGTPAYMPPEQSQGTELDARADQYAFCVALWHALVGQFPFVGRGPALVKLKLGGPPPWPDVDVPRHVIAALRRGLRPAPADRWPSLPELLDALGRDPTRWRRSLLALGGVAVVGLGVFGAIRVQRARALEACTEVGARISRVFDDARADAIATAFAATGIGYAADTWDRSRASVGAWAQQWQQTRTSVCEQAEVEHTLSPTFAQAATACLDEQLEGLDAFLEQLAVPDATVVQRAATASASLPRAVACTDEAQLRGRPTLPSDRAEREAVAAARARLSRAWAAQTTGRYDAALDEAVAVRDDDAAQGWAPLRAEVGLAIGRAQEARGRYAEAAKALEDAFYEAMGAGRDELAADAGATLVTTIGDHLARHDEGLRWGRLSQVLMARAGRSDQLAGATLLSNLGRVHQRRGEYDAAIGLRDQALAIHERILGPDHPNVAVVLNGLGDLQFARGEYDQALATHARARSILEATLGPEHPQVAASLLNTGNVYYGRGEYDQAAGHYLRALAMWEQTLGPDHPNVAACLTTLGAVRQVQGKFDEAFALHQRALAIRTRVLGADHPDVAGSLTHLGNVHHGRREFAEAVELWERSLGILEKSLGPDHPNVALALNNLGAVHHERGEYDAALVPYARALTIREKSLGPDHPDVAALLNNLGLVQHERRAYAEAVADFERALAIRERAGVSADMIAATKFGLGRSQWETGQDRAAATAMVMAARETWRAAGADGAAALAMVDEWLAAHPSAAE